MSQVPSQDSDEPRVSAEVVRALAGISRWDGENPEPWRAALATSRPTGKKVTLLRSPALRALAAAILIVTTVSVVMLPMLGKARSSSRMEKRELSAPMAASQAPIASDGPGLERKNSSNEAIALAGSSLSAAPTGATAPRVDSARQVIRKATIELKSKSVRTVFAKAAQVLSEAGGEYVESSSLTGDEEDELRGQMTLRVAAARLSTVLNQLRELGAVVNESSSGEDVTDAVVDIEARLRNEQRVEAELLQLLESRKDAPLKEILDLRSEIASIRINVERLTAQRERLGRLVSLSTILVIIHPDSTRPAPLPDGIGDYFVKQVRLAWQSSLGLLSDTVALLIKVFVGGALFWILGVIVTVAILALRRRALRKMEPAPRL